MKIMHLSDLHIGRRLGELSLYEDQKYILEAILHHVDEIQPEAVLIAGDVYDKSQTTDQATELLDWFLTELHGKTKVFVSSGNHDSKEKVAYGAHILEKSGVYMSPKYNGILKPITLQDSYGNVNIYMLPFVKPFEVRNVFPDEDTSSYHMAIQCAINHIELNKEERNIILVHQFITGAETSDSEQKSVGGLDNIDASVFDAFDYVALGHIHKPQWIVENRVRYCGTPLKYSFSEAHNENSITVLDVKEKGNIQFSFIPLVPLRDLSEIRGTFDEITKEDYYRNQSFKNHYLHITLTDSEYVTDALSRLREIYPNLLKLDYDNAATKERNEIVDAKQVEEKSPMELFTELFQTVNEMELSDEQKKYVHKIMEEICGGQE